jgi:hypothetical protein
MALCTLVEVGRDRFFVVGLGTKGLKIIAMNRLDESKRKA